MFRRRGFNVVPLIIFALIGLVYYATHRQANESIGRTQLIDLSHEQELALGLQSFQAILADARVESGTRNSELIRTVGRRIAEAAARPEYAWEFALIQSNEANAFCLPGGKVAVYTGILPIAESDDGLAVIMSHEIAHALARHGAERLAQQRLAEWGTLAMSMAVQEMDHAQQRALLAAFGVGAHVGVILPFSRNHESEADQLGLSLMARACFDPNEAVSFWQRMQRAKGKRSGLQFLSTHPSDETRIAQIRSLLPQALLEKDKFCAESSAEN